MERDVEKLIREGTAVYTPAAGADMSGQAVSGTAIGGRVGVADLAAGITVSSGTQTMYAAASGPQAAFGPQTASGPDYDDVAVPNVRKVIARAMHASLSELAQLTLNSSFDAGEIMDFRAKVKVSGEALGLENITLNDIVLFAVSRTLPGHRDLNAHLLGEGKDMIMRYFNHVHLCVAVDTPRGLLVPKIPYAETLSLNALSAAAKVAAKAAQAGSIDPDLLSGGSFTVSNLGSLGVESFTPVINPPQTAILGVDNITPRVRPGKNGEPELYNAMGLSLTFDHRAVDGAPAAKFLKELCYNLEHFTMLLVK
jgi:pyruvate dehydrogenase E2 component (dihydrolipoamide acetyltransferase)